MNLKNKKHKTLVEIIRSRPKSFSHAYRGILLVYTTQPNFQIQIILFLLSICMGIYTNLLQIEWFALIFSFGLLLTLESINTAFEIDIDLTSPTYHPYARDVKDVAAGAVLLSSFITTGILLYIFIPKFLY